MEQQYVLNQVMGLFKMYGYTIHEFPNRLIICLNDIYCVTILPVRRHFSNKLAYTAISFKSSANQEIINKYEDTPQGSLKLWEDYTNHQLLAKPSGGLSKHYASYDDLKKWLENISQIQAECEYIAWPCQCGCIHYLKYNTRTKYFNKDFGGDAFAYIACGNCGAIRRLKKEMVLGLNGAKYRIDVDSTLGAICELVLRDNKTAYHPLVVSSHYIHLTLKSGKEIQLFHYGNLTKFNIDPLDDMIDTDKLKADLNGKPDAILDAIKKYVISNSFGWDNEYIIEPTESDGIYDRLLEAIDSESLLKVSFEFIYNNEVKYRELYTYNSNGYYEVQIYRNGTITTSDDCDSDALRGVIDICPYTINVIKYQIKKGEEE